MRSLRTKLLLTFVIVGLAGALFSLVLVRLNSEAAFDELLIAQGRDNFVASVRAYYQSTGSWAGVEAEMKARQPPPQPGQAVIPLPPYALADASGRVVVSAGPYPLGTMVPADRLARGTPVEVNGERVGTVLTDDQPLFRSQAEQRYLARTQQALLWGAAGAVIVALGLGLVLARSLTRPLHELAQASRAMATGDLRQEVPVRTQDELGALAAAFNQMSHDLARANTLRREMTADIAHELRTPLTVLSGYLESMRDGTLTPTPTRLGLMDQEVQTLKRLVNDLRVLALADAGELTLHRGPVAPATLLERLAAAFAHPAQQQNVQVQVQAAPDLPEVEMDGERMVQVLSNLVANALRHTPEGGVITLAAALQAGALELTVADTGVGIPPEILPNIFERFFRGDKSRQQTDGELGLGLAIARSLVTAHGGLIRAESEPGRGARFVITLPVA